jgi:hypothetical protein
MVEKSMTRAFPVAKNMAVWLGLLIVLVSCGAATSTPTKTIKKTVEIVGLPIGVKADITLIGPYGFSTKVTGTKTFENLAEGNYDLIGKDVTVQDKTYFVSLDTNSIIVFTEETIQIEYALETELTIALRGLPDGLNPDVVLLVGIKIQNKR